MRHELMLSMTANSRAQTTGLLVRDKFRRGLVACEWPNDADSKTIAAALRQFADDLEAAGVEIGA